jgi:uncharacterized membrane protein
MIELVLFAFILPALVYTVLGNKLSRTERNQAEILTRVYIAFTLPWIITKFQVFVLIPMLWFFINTWFDNKGRWIKSYVVLSVCGLLLYI